MSTKAPVKTCRPYDVTRTKQFLEMESDNHPLDPNVWSILVDGDTVSLFPPRRPWGPGGWTEIPRDQFNAMVDWYMKPQEVKKRP